MQETGEPYSGKRPIRGVSLPSDVSLLSLVLVAVSFLLLYLPTYWELSKSVWPTDEQGHGPIILAVSGWLLWRAKDGIARLSISKSSPLGWVLIGVALLLYIFGRAQSILMFEVSSQIVLLLGLGLIYYGPSIVKYIWFPLFFMIFMIPLPESLVSSVTGPLKTAVSAVASSVLYKFGYPVGRSGVILTVGQYQLLVADACAGLNSMFTLEALGMLYMNLMGYKSKLRNIILALLLIPISFAANIVRVMILVLVTYHFGDEAGQGFVHGFAGMVLFMVALFFMLLIDKPLGWLLERRSERPTS